MQTRITKPDSLHRHGIYSAHMGTPLMGEQAILHVLTPKTTFRTRNGDEQHYHPGFEAFTVGTGAWRLIPFDNVGVPPNPRESHRHLTFLRDATGAERELAEAEARFHSPAHLRSVAERVARALTSYPGSPVLKIGLYGGLGRDDAWPGDYDMIAFVREPIARAFLQETWRRLQKPGRPLPRSCAISKQAHLNRFLVEFLHIPEETTFEIEHALRGDLTPEELEAETARGNAMAGWRWKKLDVQVLPWFMDPAFHHAFLQGARDRTFLPSIRGDIRVYDPRSASFSKAHAATIQWEY